MARLIVKTETQAFSEIEGLYFRVERNGRTLSVRITNPSFQQILEMSDAEAKDLCKKLKSKGDD